MDPRKIEEKTVGRFDTVLRYYWDGVPIPYFKNGEDLDYRGTFILKKVGYSSDYYGSKTESVSIFDEEDEGNPFSLRPTKSPSSLIGCHYSPTVGTFNFCTNHDKSDILPDTLMKQAARIPQEFCERKPVADENIRKFSIYLRTQRFIDLYESIVKEHFEMDNESLKRICELGFANLKHFCENDAMGEISSVKAEYIRSISEIIFNYICLNPKVQQLVAPLQVTWKEAVAKRSSRKPIPIEVLNERKHNFLDIKRRLSDSLLWNSTTTGLIFTLKEYWYKQIKEISLFNLELQTGMITDCLAFVKNLAEMADAALTRINVDYCRKADEILLSFMEDPAIGILFPKNARQKIFKNACNFLKVFVGGELRVIVLNSLDLLISFIYTGRDYIKCKASGSNKAYLGVNLIPGENLEPCSLNFSSLRYEIIELFHRIHKIITEFPPLSETIVSYAEMPPPNQLAVISKTELDSFQNMLLLAVDRLGLVIEDIRSAYSPFGHIPRFDGPINIKDTSKIETKINSLWNTIRSIQRTSPSCIFFGCFAIKTDEAKRVYDDCWRLSYDKYVQNLYSATLDVIKSGIARCEEAVSNFNQEPQTALELQSFMREVERAERVAISVRENECQQIIKVIDCMERVEVVVEEELYLAALELMAYPTHIKNTAQDAMNIKGKCKPRLVEDLRQLRLETRKKIHTLSMGVAELLNLFNLEISDIAAQTCSELRQLVTSITNSIESIKHQEASLEEDPTDMFQDFDPLLWQFEVLEQYWTYVFKSTTVRDYYEMPLHSINAEHAIDSVREWRRLLHCATRSLRGYSFLVDMGRQQELILASFESLEDLLNLLTTPGLRKSHWREISRLLASSNEDTNLVLDFNANLQRFLNAGVLVHLSAVRAVIWQARNDYSAETRVEEMKSLAKKTRFQTNSSDGGISRRTLSAQSRDNVHDILEDFIFTCYSLRKRGDIGPLISKTITEWEAASEKARDMLLVWKEVEQEWTQLSALTRTLEDIPLKKKQEEYSDTLILELNKISSAFAFIITTIEKPQFTLHNAIVQDTISEQLFIAKGHIKAVKQLLQVVLERKRASFARFNFLSDEQLLIFFCPNNPDVLGQVLSSMYSRLTSVQVCDGTVTTFFTNDGASLKAVAPLKLRTEPSEEWMEKFEQTLKLSLTADVRSSLKEYNQTDLQTWAGSVCVQTTELTLRLVHTENFRSALQYCGKDGLQAYRTRLQSLTNELGRVLRSAEMELSEREIISSAIVMVNQFTQEVRLAIDSELTAVSELDTNPFLQTFFEGDKIYVRFFGLDMEYGMEFLGNSPTPIIDPAALEKVYTFLINMATYRPTIVCSNTGKQKALGVCASILGRFLIETTCYTTMAPDSIRYLIRGAIESGSLLCFHNVNALPPDVESTLIGALEAVSSAALSDTGPNLPSLELPLGQGGSIISTKPQYGFACFFGTSRFEDIPKNLTLYYRPVYVPEACLSTIIRTYLCSFGSTDVPDSVCEGFALMYEKFYEVDSHIFNYENLIIILRQVSLLTNSSEGKDWSYGDLFSHSFLSFFAGVLSVEPRLSKLYEWCCTNLFGAPGSRTLKPAQTFDVGRRYSTYKENFDQLLNWASNVLIVGPPYSGKYKLWKGTIGDSKHIVFSPALMTTEDFYGTSERPGYISALATQITSQEDDVYIVIEDGEMNTEGFLTMWPQLCRLGEMQKANFIFTSRIRLILVLDTLVNSSPGIFVDFATICLYPPSDWTTLLEDHITDPVYSDEVCKVIAIVLPSVLETVEESCDLELIDLLVAAQRVASIYNKWTSYVKEISTYEKETRIDERRFAIECAIFSVCWGIGLSLDLKDRPRLIDALSRVEKQITELAESYIIVDRVFPPFKTETGEATCILEYVSTPHGWIHCSEAAQYGIACAWSSMAHIDLRRPAWGQLFSFPSRRSTLFAVECLLNSGQHVLLSAGASEGKSTCLQSIRHCDRWVQQLVSANRDMQASPVLEGVFSRLSQRSNKRYGPPIGRKLILCVDDVHVSGSDHHRSMHGEFLPLAGRILSFLNSHSSMSLPSTGYVPISDVVFFGTTVAQSFSQVMRRACIEVSLPVLRGDELLESLQQLFEASCAKRRAESLPIGVANFIARANCSYVQLSGERNSIFGSDSDSLTVRIRSVLVAANSVLRSLSGSAADLQVIWRVFNSVEQYYVGLLKNRIPQIREDMKRAVRLAGTTTIASCITPPVDLSSDSKPHDSTISIDESAVDSNNISKGERETVQSWVDFFESQRAPAREIPLSQLNAKQTGTPSIIQTTNMVNVSQVLIPLSGRIEAQNRASKSSIMDESRSRRRSTQAGGQRLVDNSPNLYLPISSKTHITTWLTTHLIHLTKVLRGEGHMGWIGHSGFGLRRILRIASCVISVPICILRAGTSPYSCATFKKDLQSVVTYACRNDTKTAIYITRSVLNCPGVLGELDIVMRTGDVLQLFDRHEHGSLIKGVRVVQKVIRPLTLQEASELRRRVRKNIAVIIHFTDQTQFASMKKSYPSVASLPVYTLTDPELQSLMQEELVASVLRENWTEAGFSLDQAEEINCGGEEKTEVEKYMKTICGMFTMVSKMLPTKLEQLIAFTERICHLRQQYLKRIQFSGQASIVISTRADDATEEKKMAQNQIKDIQTEITLLKSKIVNLTAKLQSEEGIYNAAMNLHLKNRSLYEAEKVKFELQIGEIESGQEKVNKVFRDCLQNIKNAKASQIRSFGAMLMPEKGVVLIRALFKLLGIPAKANKNALDLWANGQKVICAPDFTTRLSALDPLTMTDYTPISSFYAELDTMRGQNGYFFQLLVEYLLSFLTVVRVNVQQTIPLLEKLNPLKAGLKEQEEFVNTLEEQANAIHRKLQASRDEIQLLEEKISQLTEEQKIFSLYEKRLTKYVGLVDRFIRFLPQSEVEARKKRAFSSEGDILMIAAYSTLLSMHLNISGPIVSLRAYLTEQRGFNVMEQSDNIFQILSPYHTGRIDAIITPMFPLRYRISLLELLLQLHSRCPLFGGGGVMFERTVEQIIKLRCGTCLTISALEEGRNEKLIDAMKAGHGVLLREMNNQETIDSVRCLSFLQSTLFRWRQENPGSTSGKISFCAFGREVEVNTSFVVVCTAAAPVLQEGNTAWEWMSVDNLSTELTPELSFMLLITSNTPLSVMEAGWSKRERYHACLNLFTEAFDEACAILTEDFKLMKEKGDAELFRLDQLLCDMEQQDIQLEQHLASIQGMLRPLKDSWYEMHDVIQHATQVLKFIEVRKLGRSSWDTRLLNSFVENVGKLSPALLKRIAPQSYAELPLDQRDFYSLVNFVEEAISCFAFGWPEPIRGILALTFLFGAFTCTPIIERQRGILFPEKVALMTKEQYQALFTVLSSGLFLASPNVEIKYSSQFKDWILLIYTQSKDPLLLKVAHSYGTGKAYTGEVPLYSAAGTNTDSAPFSSQSKYRPVVIEEFFRSLVEMRMEDANSCAAYIYYTFLVSVKTPSAIEHFRQPPFPQCCRRSLLSAASSYSNDWENEGGEWEEEDEDLEENDVSGGGKERNKPYSDCVFLRSLDNFEFLAKNIVHNGTPLYFWSKNVSNSLKLIRRMALGYGYGFQWYSIDSSEGVERLSNELFHKLHDRELLSNQIQIIVTHFDVGDETDQADELEAHGTKRIRMFASLCRLASMFSGSRNFYARDAEWTGHALNPILWCIIGSGGTNEFTAYGGSFRFCCFHACEDANNPRLQILNLLKLYESIFEKDKKTSMRPTSQLTSSPRKNREGGASRVKGSSQVTEKGLQMDLEYLDATEANDKLIKKVFSLLTKQFIACEASLSFRFRLLREEWLSEGLSLGIAKQISCALVPGDEERVWSLLQILRAWIHNWKENMLVARIAILRSSSKSQQDSAEKQLKSQSILGTGLRSVASSGTFIATYNQNTEHLPAFIASNDPSAIQSAYRIRKNRNKAWQFYLKDKKSIGGIQHALSLIAEDPLNSNKKVPTLVRHEVLDDRIISQIYSVFSKLAYLVFSGYCASDEDFNGTSWITNNLIFPPSWHKVSGDTRQDACFGLEPQFLGLDGEEILKNFQQRVFSYPTELTNLCGSDKAETAHRNRRALYAQKIVFDAQDNELDSDSTSWHSFSLNDSTVDTDEILREDLRLHSKTDSFFSPSNITLTLERRNIESVRLSAFQKPIILSMIDQTKRSLLCVESIKDATGPIFIWLPAFEYPKTSLHLLLLHICSALGKYILPSDVRFQLVLSPLKLLQNSDIVLLGARVSSALRLQAMQLTGWSRESFNYLSKEIPRKGRVVLAVRPVFDVEEHSRTRNIQEVLENTLTSSKGMMILCRNNFQGNFPWSSLPNTLLKDPPKGTQGNLPAASPVPALVPSRAIEESKTFCTEVPTHATAASMDARNRANLSFWSTPYPVRIFSATYTKPVLIQSGSSVRFSSVFAGGANTKLVKKYVLLCELPLIIQWEKGTSNSYKNYSSDANQKNSSGAYAPSLNEANLETRDGGTLGFFATIN